MKKHALLIAAVMLLTANSVSALTLSAYGITFTTTGLVDEVAGLRWLDSSLTDGNLDDLQERLDQGWRIASEEDFFFLVSRQVSQFGGNAVSALGIDAMHELADRLSFVIGQEYSGPWLCRGYGDDEQYCQDTGSVGGRFVLNATGLSGDQTDLRLILYLSEVPMYGSLDCYDEPCTYEGRSLMVRAIPLPAAGPLYLAALVALGAIRRFHPAR